MKRYLVAVVGVPGSPAESQRSEVGAYRTESAARQAGSDEWRRILFVHAPHIDRYRVVIERDGAEVGEVPMPEVPADAAPGILDETVTPLGVSVGAAGERIEVDEAEAVEEEAVEEEAVEEVAVEEAVAVAEVAAVDDAVAPVTDLEALGSTGEMAVIEDEDPLDAQITGQHPAVNRDDLGEIAADEPTPASLVNLDADEPEPAPAAPPAPSYVIDDPPDGPVPEDIIAKFAEALRGEEERAAERDRDRGK
jgi:hypothetical protein